MKMSGQEQLRDQIEKDVETLIKIIEKDYSTNLPLMEQVLKIRINQTEIRVRDYNLSESFKILAKHYSK